MKSFAITLILFALVLIFVPLCAVYAHSAIKTTEALALAAYENSASSEALSELTDYWESREKILSLFISFGELDKVTEGIRVLTANAESGNTALLPQCYQSLKNSLENIHRFEIPSLEGVF